MVLSSVVIWHDLHFVTLSVESGRYQQLLERRIWSLVCTNPQLLQGIHVSALCAEVGTHH